MVSIQRLTAATGAPDAVVQTCRPVYCLATTPNTVHVPGNWDG
jgi:hypothetical protein